MKYPRDHKFIGAIVDKKGFSYGALGCAGYLVEVETPEEDLHRRIQEAFDGVRELTDEEWALLKAEAEEDSQWDKDPLGMGEEEKP